ncbi:MAG: RdgB/HAM1 family non-canonical purine NTP pyrophosphatase [Oscillospiraceae bacterium]|nr:RdgB/HAM1 family non-canonical purine NTP pyrophosphatase [Oscillospiraceae bacterium]
MKIILASNNSGKIAEMRSIFADMGIDADLLGQREAGCDFEVEETGETFEQNAYLKAKAVAEYTGEIAVADDSGLCVDALGGAPGVHSARYTGSHDDSDEARYSLLLKNLQNETERGAAFVSAVCCVMPSGEAIYTRGECRGTILRAPRGGNGFGYDPVFQPEGFERTMAELESNEKNAISHRGRAVRAFAVKFKEYLQQKD